jgi:glucan endo-1,3-alpha-glucosidase
MLRWSTLTKEWSRWLAILAAMLTASLLVVVVRPVLGATIANSGCTVGQYQVEYFHNSTLSGTPTFERCEAQVDHDWDTNGPGYGVGINSFSARWTGTHDFQAGNYTFSATADDGVRVWVDNQLIINQWKNQAANTYTTTRAMTSGEHQVKVEYYEAAGEAVAQVSWQKAAATRDDTDSPRKVFAHYMLCCPGVSATVDGFKEEIRTAQAAGLDGFALNAGSWDGDGSGEAHYRQRADLMYQAAQELGTGFKLFMSADMCCGNSATDVKDMVTRYANSPAQHKVGGKSFLSTFGGEASSFGYADPTTGWKQGILDQLAAQGTPVYFVPHFYPSTYSEHLSLTEWRSIYDKFPYVDGLFYYSPLAGQSGVRQALDSNAAGKQASDERGKVFMAGVVPEYSSHLNGNNRTGKYDGYEGYQDVWEALIAQNPAYVEVVTWNDYSEGSYIGSVGPTSDPSRDLDHTGYRHMTGYYAKKYKTGSYPIEDTLYLAHRSHDKDVSVSDPLGKPYGWDAQADLLWAVVHLTAPARVCLESGSVAETCTDVPAGVQSLSVPLQTGTQRATVTRNGSTLREIISPVPVVANPSFYNYRHYAGVDTT